VIRARQLRLMTPLLEGVLSRVTGETGDRAETTPDDSHAVRPAAPSEAR
jgi:hypothetical protein